MSYPSVVTSSSYGVTTTTNHVITLPGSLVAGNLLLLIYAAGATVSTPSGWTLIGNRNVSGVNSGVLARISDGTETSVTITSGGTNALQAHALQIDNWYGTIAGGVTLGSSATAQSGSANPPSVSHSLGNAETLFIAAVGLSIQNGSITGWPSGYNSNRLGSPGRCMVATKQATAASDDPSAFTINVTFAIWVAFAVAVVSNSAASRRRPLYLP